VTTADGPKRRVLEVFLSDPEEPRYGYDLMKMAHVESGSIYPLLARMQRQGMVTIGWAPGVDGRPPRKYYTLTGDGIAAARLELAAMSRGSSFVARPATSGGLA
jgi:PadR family transcriptional regulator PadR